MAFNIRIVDDALKDLDLIPKADARRILEKIESQLPVTALQEKLLKGKYRGLRRMRVGNFRVIFTIREDTVVILQIADSKEIYRR